MHISRSGLSCCVVSEIPYELLKRFCPSRDLNNVNNGLSQFTFSLDSDPSVDTTPYASLTPPIGLDMDDSTLPDNFTGNRT